MGNREIVSQGSCFSTLSAQAWNALKGRWLISIGAILITTGIQSAANTFPGMAFLSGWLLAPLNAGLTLFFLHLIRKDRLPDIGQLFEPFNQYWRYVWASLRMFIFVFLWSLLLIIPGIVAAFRYSMTLYIMLDDPRLTPKEAMEESCAVMYGHKWQLFCYGFLIDLIFLLVVLCTLGIGLFWFIPWAIAFHAAFYDSVRRRQDGPAPSPETEPEKIPD